MAEYKINNANDRDGMILALVNAGYTVSVREESNPTRLLVKDYYIVVKDEQK
jgi:hypothetical protein